MSREGRHNDQVDDNRGLIFARVIFIRALGLKCTLTRLEFALKPSLHMHMGARMLFFAEDRVKLQSDDIRLSSFSSLRRRTPRDFPAAKFMELNLVNRVRPINVTRFGRGVRIVEKNISVFYATIEGSRRAGYRKSAVLVMISRESWNFNRAIMRRPK